MAYPFGVARKQSIESAEVIRDYRASGAGRLMGWTSKKKTRGYAPNFATRHLPGLKLEALEPRYLLSADVLPFRIDMSGDGGADYSLRYDNLLQSIKVYDDRTGVLIEQRLAQQVEYIRVVGTTADDKLTIDFGEDFLTPIDIQFEGGLGSNHLALTGGTFDLVELGAEGGGSGWISVLRDGTTQDIGFSGTSAVSDASSAAERVFGDHSGLGQVLRISDSGTSGDGWSTINASGDALVSYAFLDPRLKLTVDAGAGDDSFALNGVDEALLGKVLLSGGAGGDAVTGPPADTDWYITAHNAGHVSGVSFVEVENLYGSADNEDTFFVSATGGLSGVMDGGPGGFDSLVLDGGTFQTVIYAASGPTSGTITRDGQVLTYDGLEPITDNTTVADLIISTVGPLGDNIDDRATLTENFDGTQTLAPVSPFLTFESITFNNPTNSLTVNLLGDTDLPVVSKDVLTIASLNIGGADLIVNGGDGKDEIFATGGIGAGDVTINAELITISGIIAATGSIILNADDEDDGHIDPPGELLDGLFVSLPKAVIDLTGATLTAGGAVTLTADAVANISASPSTIASTVDASLIMVIPTASIKLDGTSLTAASLAAMASANITVAFQDAADADDTASNSADAAVTVVIIEGSAGNPIGTGVSTTVGGASSILVSGAVSLGATTTLDVDSIADGSQEGGAKGATLAVTEIGIETTASVGGTSVIGANAGNGPDSVSVTSSLTADILTRAVSTAGGASDGGGTNKSEQRLADADNGGSSTNDQASTASGNITFAGAVAVSVYRPTTSAVLSSTGAITTDGTLTISAQSSDSVTIEADGSSTASSGTGVGVAVAFGLELATVRAAIEAGNLTATDGIDVSATMAAGDTFSVTAESGSGDGAQFQVAGSLAIHILDTTVEAVASGSIDLNGSDLTLTATSTTSAVTHAVPNGTPNVAADKGVGLSVALYIGDNTTTAAILDSATLTNVGDLTLTATGSHTDDTKAEAGAGGDGSFGLGGAIAIAVVENTTDASIGTGGAITTTGDIEAVATHSGNSTLVADGASLGGSTSIGAALALGFVTNRATSTSNRNLSAGSASFTAAADGASSVSAKASSKGEASGGDADDQKAEQTNFANSKSGKSSGTSQSASSSGGSVGVAAALALNVSTSEADASIDDVTITGDLTLASSNNMDATASADGTATDGATGVGIAVAINVATMKNLAVLGPNATVTGGFTATATMTDVAADDGADEHVFSATAISGASASDTGIAGSFALNWVDSDSRAAIEGDVTAGGGDIALTATSTTIDTVSATADQSGASATGVGASIAISVADHLTAAEVADGAIVTGADTLTVTAEGTHTATTTAESGAESSGGTGVAQPHAGRPDPRVRALHPQP